MTFRSIENCSIWLDEHRANAAAYTHLNLYNCALRASVAMCKQ